MGYSTRKKQCAAAFVAVLLTVIITRSGASFGTETEWDACETDLVLRDPTSMNVLWKQQNLEPPSCVSGNTFVVGNCECYSCRSKLPRSEEELGYFKCGTDNTKLPFYSKCMIFPRLPKLIHILDMSWETRTRISAYNFDDVTDLADVRSLLLIGANVEMISDDVLGNLTKLECVNMDRNPDLRLHGKLLHKLLSLPTLRKFTARDSDLPFAAIEPFSEISRSRVVFLCLARNFVEEAIPVQAFSSFSNLTHLDLSDNSIRSIQYGLNSSTLLTLDLSRNFLKLFPNLCLGGSSLDPKTGCPRLTHLDLSYNRLSVLLVEMSTSAFSCVDSLQYLDLRGNIIHTIYTDMLANALKSLRFLYLQYQTTDLFLVSNTRRYDSYPSTELLELHLENHNQLRLSPSAHQDDYRGGKFLVGYSNLPRLYLNGSNLHLVEEDDFVDMFGHLRSVQTLSLSNTKLEVLSRAMFASFSNMTTLVLSDNSIVTVPEGCFDPLTRLTLLDLSGNKITTVSHRTFSPPIRAGFTFLDLSQNPWTCSCDLMWFRNWFLSDHKLFNTTSASEYKCHNFHRKMLLFEYTVNEQSCLLSRETNSMIIFCCSVLITTFTIFTLLFRYRWHLRLVLYEAFRGRDDVRRRRLEQGTFEHDVFVSYAREDLNWVRQHLMPQLEDRLHLRLCIHDRQFIPGKNIVDNIADCVESSKKVLMVFSKHFIRSQWCQFELLYCLRHVMEHDDALVIVCVDEVVSLEMTSAMMAVLKTTTYIQWGDPFDAIQSFWGRLEIAFNEVMPNDEHMV